MDVKKIISEMTLSEKAAIVAGTDFMFTNPIPRLGVPSLRMSDGPHGLRVQIEGGDNGVSESLPATSFPTAATTASGWDPENLKKIGAAIAEECRYYGVHVLLGPGVNIKRNPLCGRNFEYFSEDPYLSVRALGPTPQATRASLPGRTVSALSCGRVARREPSLLECAGPRGRAVQNPTSCARGGARAPTLLPSTTTPPFLLARHGASIPRKLSCRRGPSLPLARATRAPLS